MNSDELYTLKSMGTSDLIRITAHAREMVK